MDERQSFELVMLPGFSTKDVASDVSGRGVGMDVVKTNIQKLKGSIDIRSTPGRGSTFVISLPLTLAILPVLLVQLEQQPFAVPLSHGARDHPDPRRCGPGNRWSRHHGGARRSHADVSAQSPAGLECPRPPAFGVLMQGIDQSSFILAIDGFMGREDAVVKSLDDFRPKGVSGVTTLSNGKIVLILDMKELFAMTGSGRGVPRSVFLLPQDQAA
jgi:two-component system chemotaxis sensor kinase CheA